MVKSNKFCAIGIGFFLILLTFSLGLSFSKGFNKVAFAESSSMETLTIASTNNVTEYAFGDEFTLTCATQYSDATYLWTKNGVFVSDATEYSVTNATFDDAGKYELTITDGEDVYLGAIEITINPIDVTITGVVAVSRSYNGSIEVDLMGGILVGLKQEDTEIGFELGKGQLNNKNVGVDKMVTTAIFLTNNENGKYRLIQPSDVTCTINKLEIKINGVFAKNRVQTDSNQVELVGGVLEGVILGDDVGFNLGYGTTELLSGVLSVTTNIVLTGNDCDNYLLQQPDNIVVELFSKVKTMETEFWICFVIATFFVVLVIALSIILICSIRRKKNIENDDGFNASDDNSETELENADNKGKVLSEGLVSTTEELGANTALTPQKRGFVIKAKTRFTPYIIEEPLRYGNFPIERMRYERRLIFQPAAQQRMLSHIEWGQRTPRNTVEQGGILVGKIYQCGNIVYGVVEDTIQARTQGSSAYVQFNHEAWDEMQRKLDDMNEERQDKLIVIGWYHTHPNELSVFMSGTDRGTQEEQFFKYWQFAIVLNPQKKICDAFCGKEASKCELVFLNDKLVIGEK